MAASRSRCQPRAPHGVATLCKAVAERLTFQNVRFIRRRSWRSYQKNKGTHPKNGCRSVSPAKIASAAASSGCSRPSDSSVNPGSQDLANMSCVKVRIGSLRYDMADEEAHFPGTNDEHAADNVSQHIDRLKRRHG